MGFFFEGYKRRRNEDINRYKERISQAIDEKIINGFSDIAILDRSVNFFCLNKDLFLRREPPQSQRIDFKPISFSLQLGKEKAWRVAAKVSVPDRLRIYIFIL